MPFEILDIKLNIGKDEWGINCLHIVCWLLCFLYHLRTVRKIQEVSFNKINESECLKHLLSVNTEATCPLDSFSGYDKDYHLLALTEPVNQPLKSL